MANLTITIDEQVLRRARIRAVAQGTSVNAVLREYLEAWSGDAAQIEAVAEFTTLARGGDSGSGPEGRTWQRADLYER